MDDLPQKEMKTYIYIYICIYKKGSGSNAIAQHYEMDLKNNTGKGGCRGEGRQGDDGDDDVMNARVKEINGRSIY